MSYFNYEISSVESDDESIVTSSGSEAMTEPRLAKIQTMNGAILADVAFIASLCEEDEESDMDHGHSHSQAGSLSVAKREVDNEDDDQDDEDRDQRHPIGDDQTGMEGDISKMDENDSDSSDSDDESVIVANIEEMEEDEEDGPIPVGPFKTMNEEDDVSAYDTSNDVLIYDNDEMFPVGTIKSCVMDDSGVGCAVLIQSQELTHGQMLNEGSALCIKAIWHKNPSYIFVGYISEVFGPILSPFYVVRCRIDLLHRQLCPEDYNKAVESSEMVDKDITDSPIDEDLAVDHSKDNNPGDREAAANESKDDQPKEPIADPIEGIDGSDQTIKMPKGRRTKKRHSSNVDPSTSLRNKKLSAISRRLPKDCAMYAVKRLSAVLTADVVSKMKAASKGSDASNQYDEEIPEEEQECSDDEEEMVRKKKLKENTIANKMDAIPSGRPATKKSNKRNRHCSQVPQSDPQLGQSSMNMQFNQYPQHLPLNPNSPFPDTSFAVPYVSQFNQPGHSAQGYQMSHHQPSQFYPQRGPENANIPWTIHSNMSQMSSYLPYLWQHGTQPVYGNIASAFIPAVLQPSNPNAADSTGATGGVPVYKYKPLPKL